jgi:hypothetical protein
MGRLARSGAYPVGIGLGAHVLQQHLTKLWETCPAQEPLQVGVWLFNLVPDELHTLSLFEDDERRYRISTVVDELNQRYGQNAASLSTK